MSITVHEPANLVAKVRRHLAIAGDGITQRSITGAINANTGGQFSDSTVRQLTARLGPHLTGAGPLAELLEDPEITDVVVTGGQVWVDAGVGLQTVSVSLGDDDQLRLLAQRLAAACGRRLDDAQPWVDARLPDGSRLHAVLPPVSATGVSLSLRTFRPKAFSLTELLEQGTLTTESQAILRLVVKHRLSYLVTGGTGTGKTTLLASLLSQVPANERILIVEDVTELRPTHPHVVSLQSKTANTEGVGEISLRDLVRQALRMRPDRIVVGECRGAELTELLMALNTGHDGSAGTVHANSLADVVARLEALAALGGLEPAALHAQLAAALHCVVHLRWVSGQRVVAEIGIFTRGEQGRVEVLPAWRLTGGVAPGRVLLRRMLRQRGAPEGVVA